jgi:hypothetical protein
MTFFLILVFLLNYLLLSFVIFFNFFLCGCFKSGLVKLIRVGSEFFLLFFFL